jgi:hypothetical protein
LFIGPPCFLDQEKALVACDLAHFLLGQFSERTLIGIGHDMPAVDTDRQVASFGPMLAWLALVERSSTIE